MSRKLAQEALKIARSLVSLDTKFPKFKNMIPSRSKVNDLIKIKPKGTDLEIWTWNNIMQMLFLNTLRHSMLK